MAIQTGTTYTFTQNLILEYDCSVCGEHNQATTTISESVFTSVLVRVDPRSEAQSAFESKVRWLNEGPVPDRYVNSDLSCACAKCGHREPWTSMCRQTVHPALFWVPLCIMLVVAVATPIPYTWLRLLCLFAGLIPGLSVVLKHAINRGKSLKQIKALPARSLPVVRMAPWQSRF